VAYPLILEMKEELIVYIAKLLISPILQDFV
jgi:hypothetical protein